MSDALLRLRFFGTCYAITNTWLDA